MLWVEDSDNDELLMRFAARDTPLEGRYEVAHSVAEGIDAGIRAVREDRAHRLVVVDLRLPGGSGWDVIEGLRQHAPAEDREFVVLTGSTDPVDVARTEGLGCTHLAKPYDIGSWGELVQTLVTMVPALTGGPPGPD